LESIVEEQLKKIFALPTPPNDDTAEETDLILDIFIADLRTGEFTDLSSDDFVIPIFWRPKVDLRARVSEHLKGKTKQTFKVVEKTPIPKYLWRAISPASLFRLRELYDEYDISELLERAALKMLKKMKTELR